MSERAEVTMRGFLSMQVCVPDKWTNQQAKDFADTENLCGTENGWGVREQGSESLDGAEERVCCKDRKNFVHIMLDA